MFSKNNVTADIFTSLSAAALQIISQARTTDPVPRIIIDGRSGAGKTSLTEHIFQCWPGSKLQLLSLDSVYPGWDGLEAGAQEVIDCVLIPHAQGHPGRWRRWDWTQQCYRSELEAIAPDRPLVIEGAGIVTARSSSYASTSVWVDADDHVRKARALARDGEQYRPYWEQWAQQEQRHIEQDAPEAHVTLRVRVS